MTEPTLETVSTKIVEPAQAPGQYLLDIPEEQSTGL